MVTHQSLPALGDIKLIITNTYGLFPAMLNLASNAEISSNATCGDPEPEVYCKLVEHVPGRRIKNPHCPKCDANSVLSKERHPITNAIDGTNQWWQSPSIKNGRQFHWVTITLDLKQIFQIAYIIIKAANSPRPGNWILERSLDGTTFDPWQYYAISDSECLSRYNITPRLGSPTYRGDTEVICTSYYSRLNPLEHGEIHTSLINGRPSSADPSSKLLNFTSARYIRLRLQRIRTLNADLMTLSARDPRDVDPIVTRRVRQPCSLLKLPTGPCYQGNNTRCVCEHNTCGESCNQCCPGYHQQPWQPGTISKGNTCEKCNCHNKAIDCFYNQTVAELSLSLNTHGVHHGGGVCIDCQQNTAGINCETCRDGYYRPAEVSPYADSPCVECNCDTRGSQSSVCVRDDTQPGVSAGQCVCKEGFAGRQCDRCAFGYRDFPQCVRCECNLSGSTNTDPCAPCTCKANVMGAHCDLCKPGFYNLQDENPLGCTDCFCFGVSDVCESSSRSMAQVNTCTLALRSYGGHLNYSLVYDIPLDNHDQSLPAHSDIIMEVRLKAYMHTHDIFQDTRTDPHLSLSHTGVPVSRDDMMSVLADITSLVSSGSLDVADPGSGSGVQAVAVETCECPWGYSGTSCEACLQGFYRVGGVLFGGNCLQCECNDHASECDTDGICLGCTHNTTGPHCDQCLPGFYGDATEGTADDCRLCPCPLTEPSNSFSPTCVLVAPGQVSCDQCQEGYTGTNCERCASGYYGNPQVVGGTCVRCNCNGNVDISEAGHCDTITGECLRCLGNTAGRHCEVCQPGYYGDAVVAKDCQACNCDVSGAISKDCDATTGQCLCRGNVTGRTCDRCQVGFFGLQSGQGCQACGCSQSGSLSQSCDEQGRCQCVEGVAGDKCDRCSHGYYGFNGNGCTACSCDHTGGNCDPESGECICPPHTEGDACDRCETGYWGHNPVTGCKPCSCSTTGSYDPQCELINGTCPCREGFSGRSCDQCAPGYHGYPACSACGCDVAGTNQTFCNTTLGVCDCQHNGKCVCKVGVSGRHCEECVSGWFGLSRDNPDGCSHCFCSGLSQDCEEQGGLTRVLDRDMMLDTRQLNTSQLVGPLYWRLPPQFEGKQLMSYGGRLCYTVAFYAEDGSGSTNQEPQVMMRGGAMKKIVIYTDMVAPGNGVRTQHDIRMTEHNWKYFNSVSEKPVSRADFMYVLSNVQYIIIKASYGTRMQQSRISNITMETAVEADLQEGPEVTGGIARLIESCVCPPGYTGLSCQECAAGYFRQPLSELSSQSQKSMFVRPCVRCRCNNHSESCDVETGDCQDCQHNTSGRSCELCAQGYYGKVNGSISDCSLCACPRLDNSFSATCVADGAVGDFRCTACVTGYEGRYCERCSAGYYGNPSLVGGVCSQCGCSVWGSLHPLCDPLTGQCDCKAGFKGQSCDQCEERHVLEGAECVSCDDKCTGILLDDLDMLHNQFLSINMSGIAMAPYRQLVVLENSTRDLQVQTQNLLTPALAGAEPIVLGILITSCLIRCDRGVYQHLLTKHGEITITCLSVQQLEVLAEQLDQWHPLLRKHVDSLVVGLKMTDALENVYRAENHANLLQPNEAQHKLEMAEHRTQRLMERIKPLSMLGETLSRNLSEIRALIDQARRQAASIKVAVQADKDCVRSYKPEIQSSNFNTLSLILKTTSPENLLFYMGSNTTVDFMAIEMHAGKVSLVWNVGSGSTRLDFPGLDITNNRWTRINATRFGAHASLSVHQLDSDSAPLPAVTATSPGPSRVLDVDNNTVIHIGGLAAHAKSPKALRASTFQGCVGEATLNERNIGLWNYVSREGRCGGCFSSPQVEGTSFHFDGSGFSVVQKSLRATSTSVVLLFKTLSPGGLLLYLASNNTRDFLSLELVEGKVRLTFDLGSGAIILTTNRKYNNGVWYKITLQRNKRKGTASDMNRSDLDPIYIGGLPVSRPIRRQVVSRSYVGCIKNVEIARTNFDLLRDAYGVRKGCVLKAVRSVSMVGGGFVQVTPPSLGQEVELLFSFSSNNQSGVLLAAFSAAHSHRQVSSLTHVYQVLSKYICTSEVEPSFLPSAVQFGLSKNSHMTFIINPNTVRKRLSVRSWAQDGMILLLSDSKHMDFVILRLTGGKLMMSADLGKGPASITSSVGVNDGHWHTVKSVTMKGNQLDVDNKLYLGGLPHSFTTRRLNVSSSLPGCVQSITLNGAAMDLSKPSSQHDVTSCFTKDQTGSYFNGSGYAILMHDGYKVGSDMSVSVEFRTSQSDAVFLGISSAKVDAIGLEMIGGQVVFNVNNGAGRVSVRSVGQLLCDGRWHKLLARKTKHTLSLSIDGKNYSTPNPYPQSTSAETNNPVYLGGYPGRVRQNCLSITSRFKGCLRNLQLIKSHLNHVLDLSSAHFLSGVTPDSCPVA
uniref:Laminin subunit alpha-1 n=1 Tax=Anabas testudineus TaxID=64144 RepID=A0A7N5ZS04_ANATE